MKKNRQRNNKRILFVIFLIVSIFTISIIFQEESVYFFNKIFGDGSYVEKYSDKENYQNYKYEKTTDNPNNPDINVGDEIYSWIDNDGRTHYTNVVSEKVIKVEYLPSINTIDTDKLGYEKKTVKFNKIEGNKLTPNKKNFQKNIYTYKDEDGIFKTIKTSEKLSRNFSNGVPIYTGNTKKGLKLSRELNNRNWHNKETKLIRNGNTLLVPVIIGYRGKQAQINLIVDTGCDTTLIHYDQIKSLNPKFIKDTKSTIADGSVVNNKLAKIDYIIVGPIKEESFYINTRPVYNQRIAYGGLLGMNFLKDHPFVIDANRGVIIWK